jgi:hypothetical protein|tara:strand:+ start:402 stop:677 length:276 start_codon:yes stop_codon:yes gene_type:complete
MSIIKANRCEVEIQEQTVKDAGCKYMVCLRYEPEDATSNELLQIVLSDNKPIIKQTIDLGDKIVEKNVATTKKPKEITTPEQLLGLEANHE